MTKAKQKSGLNLLLVVPQMLYDSHRWVYLMWRFGRSHGGWWSDQCVGLMGADWT